MAGGIPISRILALSSDRPGGNGGLLGGNGGGPAAPVATVAPAGSSEVTAELVAPVATVAPAGSSEVTAELVAPVATVAPAGSSEVTGGAGGAGDGSYPANGGILGVVLGYTWQQNPWAFGIEGDYSWAGIRGGSNVCGFPLHACGTGLDSLARCVDALAT